MAATPTTASEALSEAGLVAWRRFLRAHCSITRQLDAELRSRHGLTINDYDVLLRLRESPDRRLRMSELADHVMLTRSGMTRLIDGLVRGGWVERRSCDADARVAYACLTDDGLARLHDAARTHLDGVRRSFVEHFSPAELDTLAELLGRLPLADLPGRCGGESCDAGEAEGQAQAGADAGC